RESLLEVRLYPVAAVAQQVERLLDPLALLPGGGGDQLLQEVVDRFREGTAHHPAQPGQHRLTQAVQDGRGVARDGRRCEGGVFHELAASIPGRIAGAMRNLTGARGGPTVGRMMADGPRARGCSALRDRVGWGRAD